LLPLLLFCSNYQIILSQNKLQFKHSIHIIASIITILFKLSNHFVTGMIENAGANMADFYN